MFGAGADLCISDECHERPESYSNLPHSYDGPQASTSLLMGDYNFTVKDYEVFGLKAEPLYERVYWVEPEKDVLHVTRKIIFSLVM